MMSKKIVFIASSLAPGLSGVGDVTRNLALELASRGHSVLLLGVFDEHRIRIEPLDETFAGGRVRLVRFSAQLPWDARVNEVQTILRNYQPDLVSLQFVSYAYDPRGVTWVNNRYLQAMVAGWRVQVMFHELWIGQEKGATLKDQIIGWLQRDSILALLRRIQPQLVHTSNSTYVAILQKVGVAARHLPLPSAIKVLHGLDRQWFYTEFQRVGMVVNEDLRANFWLFGFFGTLHPIWPPEPLLTYIKEASQQAVKRPIFCSIGHLGSGERLWDRLALENSDWSTWIKFGSQSEECISGFLQQMDYGIAATPWEIIGKSSSATSMLEQGLPVIVNRRLEFGLGTDAESYPDPLLIRMTPDLPSLLIRGRPHGVACSRTPQVASQFLADCFG